jgi:adenine-specific DNA-methyltransferase
MTATFDYYELAHPSEGVGSGFKHQTVSHVTLRSIASSELPAQETLYDQPRMDRSRVRVTGPFTVEAVPSPGVRPLVEEEQTPVADESLGRSGETARQADWRDELLKTGIRGRTGQRIRFSRVEPLAGTRWLHAEAETAPDGADERGDGADAGDDRPLRAVVSFGPEHAPLEQRQVALAIEEAQSLVPAPSLVIYAAFQFDPEAAKDIDEMRWPGVTLLKTQMNADLLTEDLKRRRASNDSFWLIGQPDVTVRRLADGGDDSAFVVEVHGFDYYDARTGTVESGGPNRIAMWLLDPDYDGRSLFPRQVFFPLAGERDGWTQLAKTLREELDEDLVEAYRGTVSLPFEAGGHRRVAVKIVDDRGVESLKIERLD